MTARKKPQFPHPFNAERTQLEMEAMSLVAVAEAAIQSAETGEFPLDAFFGICANWKYAGAGSRAYCMITATSRKWPGFNGREDCSPIRGDYSTGKWQGMNLARRLDLIAWLLNRYTEWLAVAK